MSESQSNITFQKQDYILEVKLKNGVNELGLGPAAIAELFIQESIFQWYSEGHIIIDNVYLNFFRYAKEKQATQNPPKQEENVNKYYKFRSDGRDTIHIFIKPDTTVKEKLDIKEDIIKVENWILELEASIYDIEEIHGETNENKSLKLYFRDKSYQKMLEKNVEFSTAKKALELSGKSPYEANNADRTLTTGQAIYQLLTENGFEKHCQLASFEGNEFWNIGDIKNNVFYTSPSNSKMSQDLTYLLEIHCADESTGFDPCIFKLERNTEKGKARQFTLKPLMSYFKEAGNDPNIAKKYQLEIFRISGFSDEPLGDNTKDNQSVSTLIKIPIVPNMEEKQNFYAYDFSTIHSYTFMDYSPMDATRDITNYFLVNYNMTNKQFNIQKDLVEDAENHIKEKYLVEVISQDQTTFFPKNQFAKNGYNTTVQYTLNFTESARRSEGRNKVILSSLFKNMAISFSTAGATLRQPGRFIGILQGKKDNTQDYDNRLEGQFFLTEVVHKFFPKRQLYDNELVGVKMHLYKPDEDPIPYDDDVDVLN